MPTKILLPLFALAVLLSACATKDLQDQPPPAAEGNRSLGSVASSSSQFSVASIEEQDEAGPKEYTANLAESFIAFKGGKGGILSQEGKFNQFDVTVKTVAGKPVALDVSIDITSMETGSQGLTDNLLNPDFFETETWPTATFTADSIVNVSGDTYAVTGTLTMHGVSKTEILTAEITKSSITINHTLDRTDYGIGGPADGLKAVDPAIPLEIKVVFN